MPPPPPIQTYNSLALFYTGSSFDPPCSKPPSDLHEDPVDKGDVGEEEDGRAGVEAAVREDPGQGLDLETPGIVECEEGKGGGELEGGERGLVGKESGGGRERGGGGREG